jgi:hypothetical protein
MQPKTDRVNVVITRRDGVVTMTGSNGVTVTVIDGVVTR